MNMHSYNTNTSTYCLEATVLVEGVLAAMSTLSYWKVGGEKKKILDQEKLTQELLETGEGLGRWECGECQGAEGE